MAKHYLHTDHLLAMLVTSLQKCLHFNYLLLPLSKMYWFYSYKNQKLAVFLEHLDNYMQFIGREYISSG